MTLATWYWIAGGYLGLGVLFLAFWWLFAAGQGGTLSLADALRALFGWPYYIWLLIGPGRSR